MMGESAPIRSLTALLLTAAGQPVVMHGSDRMPTKYGVPLVEIWQGLRGRLDWAILAQTQQVRQPVGIYLPQHFSGSSGDVDFRDQIGKRPPLPLLWS